MWLSRKAELTGEPGRLLRIELPAQITLSTPGGGRAELENLATDLSAAPRLDANGRLNFSFGGKLRVSGDASGHYRGRVRITAQYD